MKLDREMVSISSLCQNYLDNIQVCILFKKISQHVVFTFRPSSFALNNEKYCSRDNDNMILLPHKFNLLRLDFSVALHELNKLCQVLH